MTRTYDCDHPYDPSKYSPHGPCCEHPRECHPPVGLDLDKLENLHQSTTPGPWRWIDGSGADMGRIIGEGAAEVCNFGSSEQYYPTEGTEPNAADMAWIVAAHEAFPAMLAEIRDLTKELEERNRELDAIEDEQTRSRDERDELWL